MYETMGQYNEDSRVAVLVDKYIVVTRFQEVREIHTPASAPFPA